MTDDLEAVRNAPAIRAACEAISHRGYRRALLDLLTYRQCALAYPAEVARERRWIR